VLCVCEGRSKRKPRAQRDMGCEED